MEFYFASTSVKLAVQYSSVKQNTKKAYINQFTYCQLITNASALMPMCMNKRHHICHYKVVEKFVGRQMKLHMDPCTFEYICSVT